MDKIPLWVALAASVALGVLVAGAVRAFLVPYYCRKLIATPVNFTLGLSNGKVKKTYLPLEVLEGNYLIVLLFILETTPANTPTHSGKNIPQRPTSLLSEDGKVLEVIAESAEMVTLSDVDKVSVGVREMNARNRALLATMDDCSILSRSLSPPNKSRLQLIDADPQINTLKYIDETLSCCKSLDSTQLVGMGESYDSRNGFLGDSCDTIARGEFDRLAAARATAATVGFDTPPPRMDKVKMNSNN
jgi:hypothetical protein